MSKAILSLLIAGSAALPVVLTSCHDSLTLQAASEAGRVQETISSPEAVTASSAAPAGDAGLQVEVLRDEGRWTFETNAVDESSYAIRVIDGRGEDIQTIEDLVSRPPFTTADLLDVRDYNADGYPDILARTLPVAASAITGAALYVFRPDSRQFIESKGIDQEGEIAIESNGCVSVEYRNDAMNYSKDHYCWKVDQWEFQRTTKD